jgi:hypothetical protein
MTHEEQILKEMEHKVRDLFNLCHKHPDLGPSNRIMEAIRQATPSVTQFYPHQKAS